MPPEPRRRPYLSNVKRIQKSTLPFLNSFDGAATVLFVQLRRRPAGPIPVPGGPSRGSSPPGPPQRPPVTVPSPGRGAWPWPPVATPGRGRPKPFSRHGILVSSAARSAGAGGGGSGSGGACSAARVAGKGSRGKAQRRAGRKGGLCRRKGTCGDLLRPLRDRPRDQSRDRAEHRDSARWARAGLAL